MAPKKRECLFSAVQCRRQSTGSRLTESLALKRHLHVPGAIHKIRTFPRPACRFLVAAGAHLSQRLLVFLLSGKKALSQHLCRPHAPAAAFPPGCSKGSAASRSTRVRQQGTAQGLAWMWLFLRSLRPLQRRLGPLPFQRFVFRPIDAHGHPEWSLLCFATGSRSDASDEES